MITNGTFASKVPAILTSMRISSAPIAVPTTAFPVASVPAVLSLSEGDVSSDSSEQRPLKRARVSLEQSERSISVKVLTDQEREGKVATIAFLKEGLERSTSILRDHEIHQTIEQLERDIAQSDHHATLNKSYLEHRQSLEKTKALQIQLSEMQTKQTELVQLQKQTIQKHDLEITEYQRESNINRTSIKTYLRKGVELQKIIDEQTKKIELLSRAERSRNDLTKEVARLKQSANSLEGQLASVEQELNDLVKKNKELVSDNKKVAYDRDIFIKGFDQLSEEKECYTKEKEEREIAHKRKIEELELAHQQNLTYIVNELTTQGVKTQKNAEKILSLANTVKDLSSL
jgi:hypothetical protein